MSGPFAPAFRFKERRRINDQALDLHGMSRVRRGAAQPAANRRVADRRCHRFCQLVLGQPMLIQQGPNLQTTRWAGLIHNRVTPFRPARSCEFVRLSAKYTISHTVERYIAKCTSAHGIVERWVGLRGNKAQWRSGKKPWTRARMRTLAARRFRRWRGWKPG